MFFLFGFISWLISFLVHGVIFVLLLGTLGYCKSSHHVLLT